MENKFKIKRRTTRTFTQAIVYNPDEDKNTTLDTVITLSSANNQNDNKPVEDKNMISDTAGTRTLSSANNQNDNKPIENKNMTISTTLSSVNNQNDNKPVEDKNMTLDTTGTRTLSSANTQKNYMKIKPQIKRSDVTNKKTILKQIAKILKPNVGNKQIQELEYSINTVTNEIKSSEIIPASDSKLAINQVESNKNCSINTESAVEVRLNETLSTQEQGDTIEERSYDFKALIEKFRKIEECSLKCVIKPTNKVNITEFPNRTKENEKSEASNQSFVIPERQFDFKQLISRFNK